MPDSTKVDPPLFPRPKPTPTLRITYDTGREEVIPLAHMPFRIGTAEFCDLRLPNGRDPRQYALITRIPGGYKLENTGNPEEIRKDGNSIKSRTLRDGDSFELGTASPCELKFLSPTPVTPDRDLKNLRMLMDITRSINSSLELEELLQKILQGVLQVIGTERGLVLLGEGAGDLRVVACREKDKPVSPHDVPRISLSIAKEVARTGRPISVKDAQSQKEYRSRDSIMNMQLSTILCVPLKIHDNTIGVLYMDHRGMVEELVQTDFQLLESLAASAAIAIENARLVEEKVHAERLSAVGQMASSLIHDIRSPITILQGNAELLQHQPALDEKGRRYTNSILREIQRIEAMATEVLDYTRGEMKLNRSSHTVREILADVLSLLEPKLERSEVRLEQDVDVDQTISVDRIKMGRVLLNLAANSIDAMPEGGRLRISARVFPPYLLLEVADDGEGIPPEVKKNIFRPFFSHGKANGTGLGMAIVKRVVEAHSGQVECESEPGHGTTLRLLLPLENKKPS